MMFCRLIAHRTVFFYEMQPKCGFEKTARKSFFCHLIFELKQVLLPPLGNFSDISYLKENFKPHLLRDVCTLCLGALVSDSLLHMLL